MSGGIGFELPSPLALACKSCSLPEMLLPIASVSASYRSRMFTIARRDGRPCPHSLGKEHPQRAREALHQTKATSLLHCAITCAVIHGRFFPNLTALRLGLNPIAIGHWPPTTPNRFSISRAAVWLSAWRNTIPALKRLG